MTIRIALNHQTSYHYDSLVTLGPQLVRLRPAPHCRTPINSYSLKVTPEKHFINWQQDPHGNWQARLVFPEKTREFKVEVDVIAEMTVVNPFDFFVEEQAENVPFEYEKSQKHELQSFLEKLPAGPKLSELLDSIDQRSTRSHSSSN